MSAGYVYVLVNSSMPGLVKVGKTVRRPSDRAQELSSATGVATPFVVAFEEPCDDCDAVELAIHVELERKGFRVAQNREFFRAEPSDVIRIVINSAAIRGVRGRESSFDDFDVPTVEPWSDLLNEADTLLEGNDETIRNVDEAIRIYKIAARMGSSEACKTLGSIYFYGLEVRQDYKESVSWLDRGVKLGNPDCYIMMSRVFCEQERFGDAINIFRKYFEGKDPKKDYPNDDNELESIRQYVHICLDYELTIEFPKYICTARQEILSRVIPRLTDEITLEERNELNRVKSILVATSMSGL